MAGLPRTVPALDGIERFAEGGRERHGFLGLDRNERLSPLPPEARAAMDAALAAVDPTTYPEVEGLYEDLAAWLDVDQARLRLTPGSDAAIRALHHCYVGPGDRTVSLDPSYAMYPIYTRMFGGEPTLIPFDGDLAVDTGALLDAVTPGVKLVLLAEPNQPTGTSLGDDVLRAVLDRAGEAGALVVVDEAYYPFSDHTVLGWLDEFPHLVVTRTFSKAWGLAGLRVGFAAADPEVAANLYKVRTAYDVSAAAAAAARALLARPEVAAGYADEVRAGREALAERARALALEPLPGATNFELIRVAARIEPAELVERLHERGTIVKGPFSTPGLAACIRVTLGPPELMGRFADQLEEVLDGGG